MAHGRKSFLSLGFVGHELFPVIALGQIVAIEQSELPLTHRLRACESFSQGHNGEWSLCCQAGERRGGWLPHARGMVCTYCFAR